MGGEGARQLWEGPWVPTVLSCPSATRPVKCPGVGAGETADARAPVHPAASPGPSPGVQSCRASTGDLHLDFSSAALRGLGAVCHRAPAPAAQPTCHRGDDARCAWKAQRRGAGRNGASRAGEGGVRGVVSELRGLKVKEEVGWDPRRRGAGWSSKHPWPPGWQGRRPGCFGNQRLGPRGAAGTRELSP